MLKLAQGLVFLYIMNWEANPGASSDRTADISSKHLHHPMAQQLQALDLNALMKLGCLLTN